MDEFHAIITGTIKRPTRGGEHLAIDFTKVERIGCAYVDITFGTFELELLDRTVQQIIAAVGVESWDALEGTQVRLRRDSRGLIAFGHTTEDRWIDLIALITRVRGRDRDDNASHLLDDVDMAFRDAHGDTARFAKLLGEAAVVAAGRVTGSSRRG